MRAQGLLIVPMVLAMAALARADAFSFTATGTPVALVDGGTASSTVSVGIGGTIAKVTDMNVLIDLTHTFDGDLVLSLRHDDTGTTALLANQRGDFGQDYTNVTFDDQAATPISLFVAPGAGQSFRPETPLSIFDGENLFGTWTLIVQDVSTGDTGTLNSFNINGTFAPEPGTNALFGLGLLGLTGVAIRRRRKAAAAVPTAR